MAKRYLAVIEDESKPDELAILGIGTKAKCEGAIEMWTRHIEPTLPVDAKVTASILVDA